MGNFFRLRQFILVLCIVMTGCVRTKTIDYLASLDIEVREIIPVESYDLSPYGFLVPSQVVKYKDWYLIHDASPSRPLVMVNLVSGESFVCLHNGRGPGEMLGGRIHQDGKRAVTFDLNSRIGISVDLDATIIRRHAVIDTICNFKSLFGAAPVDPIPCADGFIATDAISENAWYEMIDNGGSKLSVVNGPYFDDLGRGDDSFRSSYYINSCVQVSPDKTKVCCASQMGLAMSFSIIENHELHEVKRYELIPPLSSENKKAFSPDCIIGVSNGAADNQYVYLRYGGRKLRDGQIEPGWESKNIIVYNWVGEPVRRYVLSRAISGFVVEDNYLYGVSSYPDPFLFVFPLNP